VLMLTQMALAISNFQSLPSTNISSSKKREYEKQENEVDEAVTPSTIDNGAITGTQEQSSENPNSEMGQSGSVTGQPVSELTQPDSELNQPSSDTGQPDKVSGQPVSDSGQPSSESVQRFNRLGQPFPKQLVFQQILPHENIKKEKEDEYNRLGGAEIAGREIERIYIPVPVDTEKQSDDASQGMDDTKVEESQDMKKYPPNNIEDSQDSSDNVEDSQQKRKDSSDNVVDSQHMKKDPSDNVVESQDGRNDPTDNVEENQDGNKDSSDNIAESQYVKNYPSDSVEESKYEKEDPSSKIQEGQRGEDDQPSNVLVGGGAISDGLEERSKVQEERVQSSTEQVENRNQLRKLALTKMINMDNQLSEDYHRESSQSKSGVQQNLIQPTVKEDKRQDRYDMDYGRKYHIPPITSFETETVEHIQSTETQDLQDSQPLERSAKSTKDNSNFEVPVKLPGKQVNVNADHPEPVNAKIFIRVTKFDYGNSEESK